MHPDQRKNLIIGVAHETLWGIGFALIDPVTILQLALKDLGGDASLAGLLGGLLFAGLCLLQLPAAFWIPPRFTHPAKAALLHFPALACLLGLAILFQWPGLSPAQVLPWYLGLAFGFFLLIGLAVPFWMGMVTRCIAQDLRGRYFAWCFSIANLGGIATGALGVAWIRRGGLEWGYSRSFGLAFGVMSLSVALLFLLKPLSPEPAPSPRWGVFWRKQASFIRSHQQFRSFLILLLLMYVATAPMNLYTEYLKTRGLETGWWTALNAAKNTGGILGSFLLGYIADKRGPRLGLALGFSAMAFSLTCIPLAGTLSSLSAFAGGGFFITAFPVINLYMLTLIGGQDQTTALSGTFALLSAPVILLAPWASGLLAQHAGYGIAFSLSALACAAGAAFLWRDRGLDARPEAA